MPMWTIKPSGVSGPESGLLLNLAVFVFDADLIKTYSSTTSTLKPKRLRSVWLFETGTVGNVYSQN
ncbi:hypothetical protein SEA_IKELOA_168 [Mycobacterium phage IkeLoa]|nr:hypothetical protein SEA_RONAN_171 [Mycobacterium phage Ronan]UVD40549.1 hypothetical protein SEA_IKELOA_168 [Mycobacterium phage IkeLoa]